MTRGALSVRTCASLILLALTGEALAREAAPLDALSSLAARPGGLTADEVARRAAATSFEVRARGEELRAAAAGVDQALTAYFPRLSLSARYVRLSPIDAANLGSIVGVPPNTPNPVPPNTPLYATQLSFPVLLNNTTLQASLALPLSDHLLRLVQTHASAVRSRDAAKLNQLATRVRVATDGRLLFYSWVRARGQEVVAEQALAQVRAHLVDVTNLMGQGMVSRADMLRVDSQVAATELLLERSRNFVLILGGQIGVAMHDTAGRGYEIGEDILAPSPPLPRSNPEELARQAFAKRAELRALVATRDALSEQVKVMRAVALPRLDAFGDVAYANPNQRIFPLVDRFTPTWDVGLQLSWAPNDLALGLQAGQAAQARAEQVSAQLEAVKDGVRIELMQAEIAVREAELAAETTQRGLRSAEESYRVRRELFKNGRATSVELSDAEADLTRARLEAVNAHVDIRIARVKLEHAAGRDVP